MVFSSGKKEKVYTLFQEHYLYSKSYKQAQQQFRVLKPECELSTEQFSALKMSVRHYVLRRMLRQTNKKKEKPPV